MARLNLKLFYYPQNPHSFQFLPWTGHHIYYGSQHTQIGALSLGFSQLCSQIFVILEPGPRLVQGHALYGLGPIAALALVFFFLFSAFILIPGGSYYHSRWCPCSWCQGPLSWPFLPFLSLYNLRSCFLLPAFFRSCLRIGH